LDSSLPLHVADLGLVAAAGAPAAVLVLGPEEEVALRHADLLAALREAVAVSG
jgi:hypothetical protein